MFNVYGPRQFGDSPYSTAVSAWCDKIKSKSPLRSDGDGNQTRDMIYVDDVVDAFISAATRTQNHNGQFLNVGTGDRLSNNEILSVLKSRFSNIKIEQAPARAGDVRDTQADISTVSKELNWSPKYTFEKGLEKTLKWWGLEYEKQ
jgi:nucleoside-diphosphate-sugar epimerase